MKEINIGKTTIYFNEESHRFHRIEDGKKIGINSVTSFTGVIDKSQQLIYWAVNLAKNFLLKRIEDGESVDVDSIQEACKQHQIRKQEAADIGTQIHSLVERWIKGEDVELPEELDQRIRNGFEAFLKFQTEHNAKWLESEMIIYSEKYDYAGICDAIAEIDGDLVLVDFKSSNGLYPDHAFQTAAYQIAYEEMTGSQIKHRLIIRFGKEDGEFEVKKFVENEADKKAFINCLELKRRLKELEKQP